MTPRGWWVPSYVGTFLSKTFAYEVAMSSSPPPALAVNHVGVTVPDIHAAIGWYG